MARIADFFTNGGYSKALDERDSIAAKSTGQSGYSRAQTEAMKMANDMARGRNAAALGNALGQNMSASERIANVSSDNANNDFYDTIASQQTTAVDTAGQRVAQQQANAMNRQAQIGQTLEGVAEGANTGFMLGSLADKQAEQFDLTSAIERIRSGTASDDDLIGAFKSGYRGGPKTQAEYRRLGLQ